MTRRSSRKKPPVPQKVSAEELLSVAIGIAVLVVMAALVLGGYWYLTLAWLLSAAYVIWDDLRSPELTAIDFALGVLLAPLVMLYRLVRRPPVVSAGKS